MSRHAWRLDPDRRDRRAASATRPLEPRRDRQGIHRRAGLRRSRWTRAGASAALLLNVGGDLRAVGEAPRTVGIAPPRGDSEAAEPFASHRGPRSLGRHQRRRPPRAEDRRRAGTRTSSTPGPAGRPTGPSPRRSSPPAAPTPTPWRRPSTSCRSPRASAWSSRCRTSNACSSPTTAGSSRSRGWHGYERRPGRSPSAGARWPEPVPAQAAETGPPAHLGRRLRAGRRLRDQPARRRGQALSPAVRGRLGRGRGRARGPDTCCCGSRRRARGRTSGSPT